MTKNNTTKGKKVLKVIRNILIFLLCLLLIGLIVNGIITAANKGKYSEYYGESVSDIAASTARCINSDIRMAHVLVL